MKHDTKPTLATLCQQYLQGLYAELSRPVNYSRATLREHREQAVSLTYGELLFPSMTTLLQKISLQASDTFFDLGSGMGKTALQVFLCSAVGAVYGIEAVPALADSAKQAVQHARKQLPAFFTGQRDLEFIAGNFLDQSLAQATVIYTCSTSFSGELLQMLAQKLNELPKLHTVLSLKPLPALSAIPFARVCGVECSWDSALCYIYTKRRQTVNIERNQT